MKIHLSRISIALTAAALLMTTNAFARPPGDDAQWHMGPPGAEERLARLSHELQLTPEQSLQMLEILQASEAEHDSIRERIMNEIQPEVCALMEQTREQIRAILTPEQVAAFDQHSADRRARQLQQQNRDRRRIMPDCEGYGHQEAAGR